MSTLNILDHMDCIAIIGMSCRFPGAGNVDEFWRNLRNGVESLTYFSDKELMASGIDPTFINDPNFVKARFVLEDIESFDASFFEYSRREVELMDPQQRLFLECSWEALEDAGYTAESYDGTIGVFAGSRMSTYLFNVYNYLKIVGTESHFQTLIGNDKDYITSRVSYKLNLKGPSITIQSACSSSLVAVHIASESLTNGYCDIALAGGAAISVPHKMGYLYKEGMILSPDGHCRAFDAKAQGTSFGDGVGIVVLRRLEDALRNGDCIHAVIRGSAVNNDGALKVGFTAPGMEGQAAVIREAQAMAGIEPDTITYIEAHGTGTNLGDPVEVAALTDVFGAQTNKKCFCAIGSVKTNIGHLDAVSGVASLIKTVLALKHRQLPPSLHFERPNPKIDFANSPFFVNAKLSKWKTNGNPRRAGVSSFGIGGTNAHVVLEEAPALSPPSQVTERPLHLMTLSARSENALQELARRYDAFLKTYPGASVPDVCFTANVGRSHFPYRLAVATESTEQLREQMAAFAGGIKSKRLVTAHVESETIRKVAFLFTGQGSQYLGMSQQLYYTQPTFRKALDRCSKILKIHLDRPLLSVIFEEEGDSSILDETAYTQPALFALEYALAEMWRSWGIEPSVVMGHSVGEYVAACVAGVFSLEDGLKLIAARGRLIQALPQEGEMAAVFAGEERVAAAVAPYANDVSIAAVNGPENIVITGVPKSIRKILDELSSEGIRAVQLKVSHAFHSPLMDPMLRPFEKIASQIKYSAPRIGVISNITGQLLENNEACKASYWRRHVREPVRFASGMKALHEKRYELFLEIGPSPVLLGMGQRCLPEETGVWLPSLRKGRDDWQQILWSLGDLYVHGVNVDWSGFDKDYPRRRISLPTYPFERKRYWAEVSNYENIKKSSVSWKDKRMISRNSLLGSRLHTPLKELLFEFQFNADMKLFDDHRIYELPVASGSIYLEMVLAAGSESFGERNFCVEDMMVQEALYIPEDKARKVQLILTPQSSQAFPFQIFSTDPDEDERQDSWKLHAIGKLSVEQIDSPIFMAEHLSLEQIQARCSEEISVQKYYQDIWEKGLQLGHQLKWIEKLWRQDGEALAQMRFPTEEDKSDGYRLHPGLIDSCAQLIGACLPSQEDTLYMFMGYDRYRFYGTAEGRLWCHFTLKTSDSDKELISGDYHLFNTSGQVLAEATGVHIKRAPLKAFLRSIGKTYSDWLYKFQWKPMARMESSEQPLEQIPRERNSKWMIFADNSGVGDKVVRLLEERGESCVLVFPDSNYEIYKENYYKVDPTQPGDFQKVVGDVFGSDRASCRGVVHLWSLNARSLEDTTQDSLKADQALTCGSALYLCQELLKTKWSPLPRLWLVTRGVQPVGSKSAPLNVAQAPMWGLGKVIALEHAELWGGVVDLDTNSSEDESLSLVSEICKPDGEDHIAFRQGQRYVARLLPTRNIETELEPLRFPSDGTYLITGGLGGLGLEIARWMVERGARHLVLIGRRGASDTAMENLSDLEKRGAQIMVASVDVSDQRRLAGVLDKIHESMPPLRGIFHLAGVLDDGMLYQLDWNRFARVMVPKVAGAWNLHVLTGEINLDFFVMFSSMVSLVGSPGQANYAAANAFMDSLAHYRRLQGQPALSINWGPWANVGMAAGVGDTERRKRTSGGVALISPTQGLEVLEQLLLMDSVQVGVMSVKWWKFIQNFLNGNNIPLLSDLCQKERRPFIDEVGHPLMEQTKFLHQLREASQEERMNLLIDHIRHQVIEVLWLEPSKPLGLQQPLMELGLDSLMIIDLRNHLRVNLSVNLPLTGILQNPTIKQLAELVDDQLNRSSLSEFPLAQFPQITPISEERHLPFPLTDVQYAYWIGRSEAFDLGNVACHVYVEVEKDNVDLNRLKLAITRLVERHDMLRAIVLPDGQLKILEKVPPYEIEVLDLMGDDPDTTISRLEAVRQQMSHQMLPADKGPLFEVRSTLISNQRTRLHISFDLLIGDGYSFIILIRELLHLYLNPEEPLHPLDISIRDYVMAERRFIQDSNLYQHSLDYWRNRLAMLPPAPELPLAINPATLRFPRFVRRKASLDRETWLRLKARAARAGLTPSGLLLASFAEILSVWSKGTHFNINLTQFNRLPLHPQVNDMVGDFTSMILLVVDNSAPESFEARARGIQEQLWRDMEHGYVSGVQVLRDLSRVQGGGTRVTSPVVFTSVLPYSRSAKVTTSSGMPEDLPFDVIYSISQTPQVWIDHQIYEREGEMRFNWDAVEELFPEGLLDDMFDAYCHLLKRLADDEEAWQETTRRLIPAAHLKKRVAVNATDAPISSEMLHTLFEAQMSQRPEDLAVVSTHRRLTYKELFQRSNQVGCLLRERGARPNTLIAVVMEKGWEQVVAVLGILESGAAYLPIDPDVPKERLWHLLEDGEVTLVLTQSRIDEKLEWPEDIQRFYVDTMKSTDKDVRPLGPVQGPDDLAYVIYTSGSTGLPKGVMIDHRGAVNTILDVNKRFRVGPEDCVLALSSLNFDLSVYDIFGTLAAGGTIVLPRADGTKDPAQWLELMVQENITVWNSVPALMQMLVEYASGRTEVVPQSLRLVLLSGDWIPLKLPDQIEALVDGVRVISLGGATEASIWSNLYPIEKVDPDWKSIPYGRPMVNQRLYILNEFMEDCPDWVPGQLYIGGIGLAKGYWRDEEKTRNSFIIHPRTKERLYRTGDLGRYLPDGNIEFLGREDFQVKISGYRIELGEIEAALKEHPGVSDAVVTAGGDLRGSKRLVGYMVAEQEMASSLFEIESADPEEIQPRWISLVDAGRQQAQQISEETGLRNFLNFWQGVENLSAACMCRALNNIGIFTQPGEKHSLEGLMHQCRIQPRYQKLLGQWLRILEEDGLLKQEGKDTFVNSLPLPTDLLDVLWQKVGRYANQNDHAQILFQYFKRSSENHTALLRGEIEPLELFFPDGSWQITESLYQFNPMADYYNRIAGKIMSAVAKSWPAAKQLRILEVGAGTGGTTASLLPALSPNQTLYVYTDITTFFANKAKNKFKAYPFVRYGLLDIDQDPQHQGYESHSFDVVVAVNVLHDARDIGTTLQYLRSLLVPGGLILILEATRNSRLQMISVGFIEGFSHFEDERIKDNLPLLSVKKWQEVLHSSAFENFAVFPESNPFGQAFFEQHVMVAQAPFSVKRFQPTELVDFLQKKLPEYMVPSAYMLLDVLPLTPNGKIDRQALPTPGEIRPGPEKTFIAPRTPMETALADIWSQVLGIEHISIHDNFFELGGDSLLATQLMSRVRNTLEVDLSLRSLFEAPTIAELAERIQALVQEQVGEVDTGVPLPQIIPAPDQEHLPFPLTDIQQAYWIGRSGVYELGNVATHSYFEIEGADLDLERINMAWQRLIDHHGMMRAVILPDGQHQKILDQVLHYQIKVLDLRGEDQETVQSNQTKIRDEMSHQMLSTDQWPLFDVRASLFGDKQIRLHISFDNLIFDGWSMSHLLNEWSRLYNDPDASLRSLDLSFRDYVLAVEKLQESESYERDQEYWFSRVYSLPPAPELPLAQNPMSLIRQRFKRLDFRLDHDTWQQLKSRAAQVELTPSGILLAAYAEVLSVWSKNPRFTINLTLFNRLPLHPQVNKIIGDFTSLTLLAVDNSLGKTFVERARNLQQQLWQDLDHPYVGGVQVLRELVRLRGELRGAVMPVVFTSALGVDSLNEDASGVNWMGKLVYNITQTPQIWLDHQVMEQDRELLLIWDAVEELFPDKLLDDMFHAYCNLLRRLADEEEAWQQTTFKLIPASQLEKRAVNATDAPISSEMLHTLFANQVLRQPDHPAVISSNRTLSYEELSHRSNHVGYLLREKGSQPNTVVAVVMEKGWEQVVAVLGILESGAAYLPIDPDVPKERLWHLLEDGEVTLVLTQSRIDEKLEWPEDIQRFYVDTMKSTDKDVRPLGPVQGPDDLAYVIYTSGSTGIPKGVMIDHRGAVNTILDVNRRFGVDPGDRVLALSNLNFDLSVYDIFGTLAAGGTIVLPEATGIKDPAHWSELMRWEEVTVWNSVPALMQMLVEYASGRTEVVPQSLRLVLLSGDWIPLELPDRIRTFVKDVRVISLGGATEASIWSNLYPIKEVDTDWKSIPYGRPMVNQRFYILNEFMEDCPDWVSGQLYIGGIGLAQGYWHDGEKTGASFIIHPQTGERLYRTGDLGRYLPDGNIEFLGREDFQVKISGYRIELGEIEAALKKYPGLRDAVVTAIGDSRGDKRLVAYVVSGHGAEPSTAALRDLLKEKLPEYMVPSAFVVLDAFPLTPNGKVDRKALPGPGELSSNVEVAYIAPQTEVEQTIATILQEVLDIEKVGIHDNFFDVGANSLHLVRAQNKLQNAFKRDISVLNLFEYTTISALAEYLSQRRAKDLSVQQAYSRAGIRRAAMKRRVRGKDTINNQ